MNPRIAVLALQGAFREHMLVFAALGAECFEIRQRADLDRPFDALVLPGGESTVQGKLLRELGLFDPLRQRLRRGMPVLATCAGTILLAERIASDSVSHFATLPITVERNAYGRQLSSFHAESAFAGMTGVPMPFIRAPRITACAEGVEVLAEVDKFPVAVRYGRQLALTFHPEITADRRIHAYFLREVMR
ncbi:MAG: pyridoxal 5'-phosphate synthase glutaminase subunit PdxT [Lentisphaeria bacterium]|nr:pyridoxal 5'-phosphate synthase glutaminase subunit PdxT [Lentisphaeria bacterium]